MTKTAWFFLAGLAVMGSLLMGGCGPELPVLPAKVPEAPSRTGKFVGETCFKNKLASQGFGQDIYTIASIRFNEDGTGLSEYSLYADSDCATLPQSGEAPFHYEIEKTENGISVIRIEQLNDPNDPSSVMIFWYVGMVTPAGYYLDVDDANGDSGPYVSEPSDEEVSAFAELPLEKGVFFRRDAQ
jgi:hypothetical protein